MLEMETSKKIPLQIFTAQKRNILNFLSMPSKYNTVISQNTHFTVAYG